MENVAQINNSPSNGENQENTQTIKREPIPHTPFVAVKVENDPYFLTWGKYRLPYGADTIPQLKKIVDAHKWEITAILAGIVAEETVKAIINDQKDN